MLTLDEMRLIADTLNGCSTNGCHLVLGHVPHWFDLMAGGGLEQEISFGMEKWGLDTKWGVDGPALLAKLEERSPHEKGELCRGVVEIWERNDEHFDRDLEQLAVTHVL